MNTTTYNERQVQMNEWFLANNKPKKRKQKATKVFSIRLVDKDGERMAEVKRYEH